jgi:hypothetical protein
VLVFQVPIPARAGITPEDEKTSGRSVEVPEAAPATPTNPVTEDASSTAMKPRRVDPAIAPFQRPESDVASFSKSPQKTRTESVFPRKQTNRPAPPGPE